jgi:ribosomal protein S18 acetylase RimI-like enzyme
MPGTLSFVTAEEASIDAFLSTSAASQYQEQLRVYLDSLLEQQCTRPGWCLLGVAAGKPIARAALWSMPKQTVPTDVVLIDTDWSDEDLSPALAVLERAHGLARDLGSDALSHSVDSPPGPPQYQEEEAARVRLLTDSGYELLRDGLRWRYSGASGRGAESSLAFRGLPEVGEDAFVQAIAATYEGTRDSWISRTIDEQGLVGAARADFRDYQGMEHLPEWWELAYAEDGALAGVIMAARNPSTAVIGYVGVVPAQRGRGLAPQLVRRGTEQLLASGADEIRGDCDRDNVGMVKAFERAGYEEFARRRTYQLSLAADSGRND